MHTCIRVCSALRVSGLGVSLGTLSILLCLHSVWAHNMAEFGWDF